MDKYVAVVCTYSFETTVDVYLFSTIQEGRKFLKEWILSEHQNDLDCGFNSEYRIDDDKEYGRIEVHFPDHTHVTEAKLGLVHD
jgi:hypothetical protein